jgi:hypothetical protein
MNHNITIDDAHEAFKNHWTPETAIQWRETARRYWRDEMITEGEYYAIAQKVSDFLAEELSKACAPILGYRICGEVIRCDSGGAICAEPWGTEHTH